MQSWLSGVALQIYLHLPIQINRKDSTEASLPGRYNWPTHCCDFNNFSCLFVFKSLIRELIWIKVFNSTSTAIHLNILTLIQNLEANSILVILYCMLCYFYFPNFKFVFSKSLPAYVINLKILHKHSQPSGWDLPFFETNPYVFIPHTKAYLSSSVNSVMSSLPTLWD